MLTLFRLVSLRHLLEDRLKTLVAVLGVALGIAVFLSIRLANGSVLGAFRSTVDVVSGKATLQVSGSPTDLGDDDFRRIKATPGVAAAAPIIEATVVVPAWDRQPITVLGVDVFSEPPFRAFTPTGEGGRASALAFLANPRALAVTDRLAEERGVKVGDSVRLLFGTQESTWRVTSILASDDLSRAYAGRIAMVDIAAAQEAFGKVGRLDRVDILTDKGAGVDGVRARLLEKLGPRAVVNRPRSRTEQVENLLGAFQLNLTALSAIAIFVGMFLIYNAMSIAVVRRRREIGILREVGVTQGQVLRLFLAEGAFYGLAGAALGVAAGIGLANAALRSVATTVSALYVRVEAERIVLDPVILAQAVGIGFGTAVLASLAPALEAAATPPGQTAREGSLAERARPAMRWFGALGVALLAVAGALSWAASTYRQPYLGFTAAFAILGGFSLVTPAGTALLSGLARPVWNRVFGVEGLLAAGYINAALDRTAVVVAALMVSLAMFIGVSVMVGSFRRTVQAWVDQTIRADVYVQAATWDVSGSDATLPPDVVAGMRRVPGVAALDEYRAVWGQYGQERVLVSASTFDTLGVYGRLLFQNGDTESIVRRAKAQDEIIVTEGLSLRFRKRAGDTLRLDTPTGPRDFRIAGVYHDYTTNGPTLVMDLGLYRRLWPDDAINSVAVYLRPNQDPEAARRRIEQLSPAAGGVATVVNRELHEQVLRIFDQTFRVTYALEFISIIVAVLGIINTMTALILQRGRELGILRAVGATRPQLKKVILLESGLIGVIGYAIGAVCGSVLALLLIYVINKQFFGWTVQVQWTPGVFLQGAGIMVVTSLLAGYLPARQAAARSVTEAVRAE